MISLDGPLALNPGDTSALLRGWCNDTVAPMSVRAIVDDVDLPVFVKPAPQVNRDFPQLRAVAFESPVNFVDVYRQRQGLPVRDLFSLVVMIRTPREEQGFEVTVSQEWADRVFAPGRAPRIKPPAPPNLMVRVAGGADPSFYPSGRKAVAQMKSLLEECQYRVNDGARVLDFGCGCGRILVNVFHAMPGWQLFGTDVDEEAIAWCRENLASAATFDANAKLPPLRYESETFDLVYCVSVFTHLPRDLQLAWLGELRRILRPGGVLITTIHGPKMHAGLPPEVRKVVAEKGFVHVDETNPDWPAWLGAKTQGLPEWYRLTYHGHEYVRRTWSQFFEILLIREQGLNFEQDAVVCRKRREGERG